MKISAKLKLENLSIWTLVITVCFIVLFFIGNIVSYELVLDSIFSRGWSEGNYVVDLGSIAFEIMVCFAFLNIALNISLNAARKTIEFEPAPAGKLITGKIGLYFLGIVIVIASLLFLPEYLRKYRMRDEMISEATELVNRSQNSLARIAASISDTSSIGEVPGILKYFEDQTKSIANVSLITIDRYNGDLVILKIHSSNNDSTYLALLKKPLFNKAFYKYSLEDGYWLNRFLTGKTENSPFWSVNMDHLMFYFPVETKGKRFVLLFSQ